MPSILQTVDGKYRMYTTPFKHIIDGLTSHTHLPTPNPLRDNIAFNWSALYRCVVDASLSISDISTSKIFNKQYNSIKYDNISSKKQLPTIINDNDFWHIIAKIISYDRDEGIMTRNSIRLTIAECTNILAAINFKYIPELKEKLRDVPIMDGIEANDYNNLLTHIIARGKSFYIGIMNNPIVSLYICEQFYPVHTWLTQLVN
jgi:hypothetical protein